MATKHPVALWVAFTLIASLILAYNTYILIQDPVQGGITGYSTANIALCINTPPTINLSGCPGIAFTEIEYTCTLNASDAQQNNFSYSVTRLSGPAVLDALLTITDGVMNFTTNNSYVGNYTLRFTVDDQSGCAGSTGTEDLDFDVYPSSNNPYLVSPVPDKNWTANQVIIAYNLNTYFDDPNGDALTFRGENNTNVGIDITAQGEVTYTPAQDWCGTEQIWFVATDPTNLTATSNVVTLTVSCVSAPSPDSGESSSSSGGGGGGGGGSASRYTCVPEYACYEWSSCQLTRIVSPATGTSNQIEITGVLGSRIYTIPEEYTKDPDAYYEGFQYRECIDTRSCEEADTSVDVRPCSYKPSCSDHIQNQDETGVDCGGVCGPCSTCSDGIQNGLEEGVDCGGACTACNSCSNGKIDGQELGVDCGGPDCPVCATCFDGIKNQDEAGIDCGGKYCKSCSDQQYPLGVSTPWLTLILLALVALVLGFLFFAAIKRHFAAMLMEYFLKHKKTNRIILLPADLKAEIINRLNALETQLESQPILKSQEDLARIIRDYFKVTLGLEFEFTYEELVKALAANKLNPLLSKILQQFFMRISVLEFSGVPVSAVVMRTLIQETRELVYQTAVLTIDDLKEREKDIALRDIPAGTPSLDRGYLLLSQVHLALQFGKLDIAQALYTVLHDWYAQAPVNEQQVIYDDFNRLYDEYTLATQHMLVK